jgi:hypothetical protein
MSNLIRHKRSHPIFIISLNIYDMESLACGFFRSPTPRNVSQGGQVKDVILIKLK